MKKIIEKWKDVFDLTYSVSNLGRIKHNKSGRIPKLLKDKCGYLHYRFPINKKWQTKSVHRLVAKAFIPNPKNLPQVNHKNGIKSDNNYLNLQWISAFENIRHALKNGRMLTGERHPKAILSDDDVRFIRNSVLNGTKSRSYLSEKFGVSKTYISTISHSKYRRLLI